MSTRVTKPKHAESGLSTVDLGFTCPMVCLLCMQANEAGEVAVPLSVAYRPSAVPRDGSSPCFMHVYGAYGARQVGWGIFSLV